MPTSHPLWYPTVADTRTGLLRVLPPELSAIVWDGGGAYHARKSRIA